MKDSTKGVIKQFLAGTSAALSLCIAGCWLGWPSPSVERIQKGETHLKLTQNEISWVVSLMDFGNILSPIPSGYMSNFIGRKRTLLLTSFLYTATWALVIFSTSVWPLYVARVGAGIGKGMAYTVVPMYLSEIAGVRVRGAISTIFTGLLYSGLLFEYSIGPYVSFHMLNIISGVIPIIFFFTFFMLPDTPYYHLMKGRNKEAGETLAWFRHAKLTDQTLTEELEEMEKTVHREMLAKGRFVDLVTTQGNRKAMTIVLVLSACQRFAGISPILAYSTVTLPKTGGYFGHHIYMIIFGLTMVIGNFMGTPLVDKLGRKPLLIFSCTACALMTGISAVFYGVAGPKNDLGSLNWIPHICLVAYGIAFSIGIGIIPSTFVGELFPTNIKCYASSIASVFFAIASFTINKVYLLVKSDLGAHYMFGFFTLSSMFSVVFTVFMVFETKNRRFSDIQNELNKIDTNTAQRIERQVRAQQLT